VCDKAPLTPSTVIGYAPGVVDAAVVMLSTELPRPVTEPGVKDATTPRGVPLAVRLTIPLNPFNEPTLMVELDALPAATAKDTGDAAMVKSGATTVRVIAARCNTVPLTPWTVIRYAPVSVEAEAVKVRSELPVPVTEFGEKAAVIVAGIPLAVRFTAPLNPNNDAIEIVELAVAPVETVIDAGDAVRVKFGVFTVKLSPCV
jgi:hypothetical protein